MIRFAFVHIAWGLMHINGLRKVAMEEGVLDVKLMKWPVSSKSNVKNCAYCSRFDNGAEGLIAVNSKLLGLPICNEAGLVFLESSISIKFMLIATT